MNLIETSQLWLDRGIATIPVKYREKIPAIASWTPFKTTLPTPDDFHKWYDNHHHNIGLICGWNGLVVLDFDKIVAYDWWKNKYKINSYEVKTARGMHVYVYLKNPPALTIKWRGGDIKATGYVLIPPSVHPSGWEYCANDKPILTFDSINDLLPSNMIETHTNTRLATTQMVHVNTNSIVNNRMSTDRYANIKANVRIVSFFPNARSTGNGWYAVRCPLHQDKNASAWIDDRPERNRFGCHACTPRSISVIDLYSLWHGISIEQAVNELEVLNTNNSSV